MPSKRITVYCASTSKCETKYLELAESVGMMIGEQSHDLVYGGSYVGCMKAVADGARNRQAKVIGIIPEVFRDMGIADEKCDELIVTETYRERKELLAEKGELLIALPGGLGTVDEFMEALMLKSIGLLDKPLLVIDPWNDYDHLHELLDHLEEKKMIREGKTGLYQKLESLEELKKYLTEKAK